MDLQYYIKIKGGDEQGKYLKVKAKVKVVERFAGLACTKNKGGNLNE